MGPLDVSVICVFFLSDLQCYTWFVTSIDVFTRECTPESLKRVQARKVVLVQSLDLFVKVVISNV